MEWFKDGLALVGGGTGKGDIKAPEGLAESVQGTLVHVGAVFDGSNFKLYTNETEVVSQERKFSRSRYLRITLGGNGEDQEAAVYLARVRVATGAPATGPQPGIAGGATAPSSGSGSGMPLINVIASVTAQGAASASWNSIANAVNYFAIRWKPDEPGCCTNMSSPGPTTALSWQDGTLPKQGTYKYRVYASTSGGASYTGETTFSWPQAQSTGMPRTGGTVLVNPTLPPPPPPPPPPPAPVTAVLVAPAPVTGTITPMPAPAPAPVDAAPRGSARTPTPMAPANPADQAGGIRVGTGISDITGPIAEVVMMGYADGEQKAKG